MVNPYEEYSWVLRALLKIMAIDRLYVRKAVTNVLGTIGAIDPASFRVIEAKASGEGRLEQLGVRPIKRGDSALSCGVERPKQHHLGEFLSLCWLAWTGFSGVKFYCGQEDDSWRMGFLIS